MRLAHLQNSLFFIALLINAIILAASLFLDGVRYESLDDYFMHSVLTGAYGGEYDVHLYFINAVYGYFLKPFYAFFPTVGWYSIFEILAVFCSFVAISFVVLQRFKNRTGKWLALLVIACVSPDFYLHVAFTQCAAVATAAGILLFAVGRFERNLRYLLLACPFLIAGFVFRINMFQLGLPTLAVIVLYNIVREKKIWFSSLAVLAILAGLLEGIKAFDSSLYKGDGYDYYAAYQGVRSYFGDGAFYDQDALTSELEERGIGSRDLRYLNAWYFYDNNVFSRDSLNNLIRYAERYRFEPNYAKMPFAVMRAISNTLMRGSVWCWALICLSLIYFSNRKNWWVPWVSVFLICIPYTYLLVVNRVVDHVESGVWAFAVVFVLSFLRKEYIPENSGAKTYLQIVALVCVAGVLLVAGQVALGGNLRSARADKQNDTDWDAFLQYAAERSDDVFLLSFDRYQMLATYRGNIYKAVAPRSLDNIYSTGYWNIHLPAMNRELEKRGVSNIFKDIKNKNVYMMDDVVSLSLVPYYSEHYHEMLEIDTLRTFGSMRMLKYHLAEEHDENEKD